ncbi:hypothetical protein MIND_00621700 [Mycena indigotica]|uniref:Uncharacterized protein n=1 Tax=Mycena indigotica TaxID=2126181 RepID=A0A8H6ST62_9AGAR|nr:uncharacterized protein MIND_00621700 [Mycena indigotica]KAF7303912.1 hypothetical protein MIND_00621700 [Mycena indigotica]
MSTEISFSPPRLIVLIAELILTVLTAFGLLLILLLALGHDDTAPLGILHITIACTLLVYAAMEGTGVLVRSHWFKRNTLVARCKCLWLDGREDEESKMYGTSVIDRDVKKGPFSMTPGRSRKGRIV